MFTEDDHTFAVCAYGESPYLDQCLKSLSEQELKTNVLISTSTPNETLVKLSKQYGYPLYINEGKPGIGHDWNCAIAHCQTPLVTIAHQDDVYLPAYSKIMLSMINQENHPLIWFSDYGELRGDTLCDESRLLRIKRLLLKPLERESLRRSVFIRRRILSFGSAICCPAVTYCIPNLPAPIFLDDMKCDLDWQAWERFSRLDGSFIYTSTILMRHRIHEGSETTALILDDTRTQEDIAMLKKFWPTSIAKFINRFYSASQTSNHI